MDHKKVDVRGKMAGPVIAAIVMILLMAAIMGILVWAQTVDPIPLPIWIFFAFIPTAICIGVLLALRSRFKEVQSGEEEDADQY